MPFRCGVKVRKATCRAEKVGVLSGVILSIVILSWGYFVRVILSGIFCLEKTVLEPEEIGDFVYVEVGCQLRVLDRWSVLTLSKYHQLISALRKI